MPRVSRKRIKKELEAELKDNFAYLISSLNNSLDIEGFFEEFLTSEEKIMLAKRLMLYLMFENNYKTSQIGSLLGMSRETIRIHKNIWNKGGGTYKKIIGKIAKREKTKQFWQNIEKFLEPIDLAFRAKTDMKARAKLINWRWDNK